MSTRATDSAVYRPHRALAAAMAAAMLFWGYALYFLSGYDGVPWKTLVTAAVFTAFFAVAAVYYARSAVLVDDDGFTVRGLVRTSRFRFDDILAVRVLPGPLTVYSVNAANRFIHFTSFYRRHKKLMQTLVERSGRQLAC
jgi:hypothetical protein